MERFKWIEFVKLKGGKNKNARCKNDNTRGISGWLICRINCDSDLRHIELVVR